MRRRRAPGSNILVSNSSFRLLVYKTHCYDTYVLMYFTWHIAMCLAISADVTRHRRHGNRSVTSPPRPQLGQLAVVLARWCRAVVSTAPNAARASVPLCVTKIAYFRHITMSLWMWDCLSVENYHIYSEMRYRRDIREYYLYI